MARLEGLAPPTLCSEGANQFLGTLWLQWDYATRFRRKPFPKRPRKPVASRGSVLARFPALLS
jgi:hypothetical protein